MASKIIKSIEIPVLAAQTAAAALSVPAASPFIFFIFQFIIALFIIKRYRKTISAKETADFYYAVSLIFGLAFLWYPIIKYTNKLCPAGADNAAKTSAGATLKAGGLGEELIDHIKADWDSYTEFKAYKFGGSSLASNAIPIIDLLSGGDIEVKRKSVVILHKLKTIKSIMLLKKALSDANVEIKFMAASALLNIENDFKERIGNIEDEIAAAEEEGYDKIYELRYNLAALISKYLMSGLLDDIEQKRLSGRMHALLNAAIAENKDYIEARALLAGEYYKKAGYADALRIVEAAINGPELNKCGDDVKISLIMLLCEINYRLYDIEKLRRACLSIKKYLTPDILKKRPELLDFEKSVRYFGGDKNRILNEAQLNG
jgi:hypothetical protein